MEKTKYIGKKNVAKETIEFSFLKPASFAYQAGQSIDLTLIDPPETDVEGTMRAFSLSSAPSEPTLKITTRMRDTAFKRVLQVMTEGTEVGITGPFGSFLLHENIARPAIFLAGGIGITPFRSIVLDAVERKLPHKIILFSSNRQPADAAFMSEFEALANRNKNFIFVPTMTQADTWNGERGYVDAAMLERYVPKNSTPIYYLAGPQRMVFAMRETLKGMGVSGDDIRFEEFAGY